MRLVMFWLSGPNEGQMDKRGMCGLVVRIARRSCRAFQMIGWAISVFADERVNLLRRCAFYLEMGHIDLEKESFLYQLLLE